MKAHKYVLAFQLFCCLQWGSGRHICLQLMLWGNQSPHSEAKSDCQIWTYYTPFSSVCLITSCINAVFHGCGFSLEFCVLWCHYYFPLYIRAFLYSVFEYLLINPAHVVTLVFIMCLCFVNWEYSENYRHWCDWKYVSLKVSCDFHLMLSGHVFLFMGIPEKLIAHRRSVIAFVWVWYHLMISSMRGCTQLMSLRQPSTPLHRWTCGDMLV